MLHSKKFGYLSILLRAVGCLVVKKQDFERMMVVDFVLIGSKLMFVGSSLKYFVVEVNSGNLVFDFVHFGNQDSVYSIVVGLALPFPVKFVNVLRILFSSKDRLIFPMPEVSSVNP